jgi:hypothetical protein
MRVYQLKQCSLANEFGAYVSEVLFVMKDQSFGLILGAARTQQWNMRIHVAIPPPGAQDSGAILVASLSESGGSSGMLPLLHQTYREGNKLVYEPGLAKRMRACTYIYDTMRWAGAECRMPRDDMNIGATSGLSGAVRGLLARVVISFIATKVEAATNCRL